MRVSDLSTTHMSYVEVVVSNLAEETKAFTVAKFNFIDGDGTVLGSSVKEVVYVQFTLNAMTPKGAAFEIMDAVPVLHSLNDSDFADFLCVYITGRVEQLQAQLKEKGY